MGGALVPRGRRTLSAHALELPAPPLHCPDLLHDLHVLRVFGACGEPSEVALDRAFNKAHLIFVASLTLGDAFDSFDEALALLEHHLVDDCVCLLQECIGESLLLHFNRAEDLRGRHGI